MFGLNSQQIIATKNCYNIGKVEATGGFRDIASFVGGIAGQLHRYGTIENCYNLGTVVGDAYGYVGGIVRRFG